MWNYWDIWRGTCILIQNPQLSLSVRSIWWLELKRELKNKMTQNCSNPCCTLSKELKCSTFQKEELAQNFFFVKCQIIWHNAEPFSRLLKTNCGSPASLKASPRPIHQHPPTPLVSPALPKSGCFAICRVNWTPHWYLNATHIASAIVKPPPKKITIILSFFYNISHLIIFLPI